MIQKIVFLFFLGFIIAIPKTSGQEVKPKKTVVKKTDHKSKYYKTARVDVDSVILFMDSIKIKHSKIVLKQALLETGHFKARLLMDKNNLFAFRYTRKYMNFESWQASVIYYKKWQDKRYKNDNEDYYHFLKRIKYAHDANYIATLKRMKIKSFK